MEKEEFKACLKQIFKKAKRVSLLSAGVSCMNIVMVSYMPYLLTSAYIDQTVTRAETALTSYSEEDDMEKLEKSLKKCERYFFEEEDVSLFYQMTPEEQLQYIKSVLSYRSKVTLGMSGAGILLAILGVVTEKQYFKKKKELDDFIYDAYQKIKEDDTVDYGSLLTEDDVEELLSYL